MTNGGARGLVSVAALLICSGIACGERPASGRPESSGVGLGSEDPARCPCEMALVKIAELSSAGGEFVPSMSVSVARFSDGRFAVAPLFRRPAIVLYSADGRIRRLHDRKGSGPGELASTPVLSIGPGDTLHAFSARRLVRFDREMRHIDTRRVLAEPEVNAVILRDGRIVVDGPSRAAGGARYTLQLIAADGQVAGSFEPRRDPPGPPALAGSSGGGWWVANRNDSEIRYYSPDGAVARRITVRRDWFEAWEGRIPGEILSVEPRPRNVALMEAAPGVLLLATSVADENWVPESERRRPIPMVPGLLDGSVLWDTIVQAVGTGTGEVLASTRVPELLQAVSGTSDEFFSTRLASSGHVSVDVWRVSLVPSPR